MEEIECVNKTESSIGYEMVDFDVIENKDERERVSEREKRGWWFYRRALD